MAIGPFAPDATDVPLTVGIQEGDVVLLMAAEGLGVLLDPKTARALGRSLIAASEEVAA